MIKTLFSAAAFATLILTPALAQEPPVARKLLEKMEFPPEQYATILGSAVLQPGAKLDRHTHPGIEMGMAMEGEMVLLIEGQAERSLKAGDTYQVPAGVPHSARNTGAGVVKVVAVWVVEKAKPLASPAP